jgi:periplasmic copper chaperone A
MMKARRIVAMTVPTVLIAAACSNGSAVSVSDAWGRPTPDAATNTAFYLTITGGSSDDRLVSVSTDACGDVQLHETAMTDGSMTMQEVPGGIPVPSEGTVILEPGGLHVMCMGVVEPLVVGDSVELQLDFEDAGTVSVSADVRDGAEGGNDMGMTTTSAG